MYYYFYHGFDLREINQFLCKFECIEFECNEFVLVLVFGRLFGGSSELAGTCSTLFSSRLFWRQLKFGGNWLHIIFQQIVLEVAQIWRELAPHYIWWIVLEI